MKTKNLSIIFGGRDDNYGEYFIERLFQALSQNLLNIQKIKMMQTIEIIVVDYNPVSQEKWLIKNPKLSNILNNQAVLNVIVDREVLIKEKLQKEKYYEYFAKNVGIRNSNGHYILITNSDIIFPTQTLEECCHLAGEEKNGMYFHRIRYRRSINLNDPISKYFFTTGTDQGDLHVPTFEDSAICGFYSGDATVFTRHQLFEMATGYDETNPAHRGIKSQSNMDGEILWNLKHKGVHMKFINNHYYHIEHGRPNERDGIYIKKAYRNQDEKWGCQGYKKITINKNTTLIAP